MGRVLANGSFEAQMSGRPLVRVPVFTMQASARCRFSVSPMIVGRPLLRAESKEWASYAEARSDVQVSVASWCCVIWVNILS